MAASNFLRSAGKLFMMNKESRFALRALAVTLPNAYEPMSELRRLSGELLRLQDEERRKNRAGTCTTLRAKTSSLWQQC